MDASTGQQLVCPRCGNTHTFRAVRMHHNGTITATCDECGQHVTSTGGTVIDTVTGGMTWNR